MSTFLIGAGVTAAQILAMLLIFRLVGFRLIDLRNPDATTLSHALYLGFFAIGLTVAGLLMA